ncbi:probable tubulin polyglutamylase TTLL9 [Notechis scutatus]|uniref:Tubulin--tyrosine ligase-like protein 9 n=1 Tax=Notechis scutatus TaxID=8663 RepID=A0A6J1VQL5_9SAUR|nr:probable tubulin polyglutamylase TTLL9 [Notechis scutatus]
MESPVLPNWPCKVIVHYTRVDDGACKFVILISLQNANHKGPHGCQKLKEREPRASIRFKCALTNTILDVLQQRPGWVEVKDEGEWDFYWCDVRWLQENFDHTYMDEHVRISHFRNHYELTRKNYTVKNLKRLRKQLERESGKLEAMKCDFFPKTFEMPSEYHLFVEEFRKNPGITWIMKPGCKWMIQQFRLYLTAKHGAEAVEILFSEMDNIFIKSLQSVQKVIISDKHCFELYGYDILIDQNLKPWLLEVNASPSLTASSQEDHDLKTRILEDTLNIVDMEGRLTGKEKRIGGFDLMWNDGPVSKEDTNLDTPMNGFVANTHLGYSNDRKKQLKQLFKSFQAQHKN